MFTNYKYEKPAFVSKTRTDALTAAFAGGGWLHLNDQRAFDPSKPEQPFARENVKEVFQ